MRAEVTKTSSLVNLSSRYMWAISNVDIYVTKNWGLTDIKKIVEMCKPIIRVSKRITEELDSNTCCVYNALTSNTE